MNALTQLAEEYHLPGDMIGAFKTRPISEWNDVFQNLQFRKSIQISGRVGPDALIQLQAEVKALQELHQFILAEMQR